MRNDFIKFLGYTDTGKELMGGFFTAHDTYGFHTDFFMSMFLEKGFCVSIPYFQCECLLSPARDPDVIWPMLDVAYKEARMPFDLVETRKLLNVYLDFEFRKMSDLRNFEFPLQEMAKRLIKRYEDNGMNTTQKIKQLSEEAKIKSYKKGDKHAY